MPFGLRDLPDRRQQQAQGEVRRLVHQHAGGVGHDRAGSARRRRRPRCRTHAEAGDDLQRGQAFDQVGADLAEQCGGDPRIRARARRKTGSSCSQAVHGEGRPVSVTPERIGR
jgi:hypothetical protein